MDYVKRAKELAKRNAPDGAWNELIVEMSIDELITDAEYVELYSKVQDIYWHFLMED